MPLCVSDVWCEKETESLVDEIVRFGNSRGSMELSRENARANMHDWRCFLSGSERRNLEDYEELWKEKYGLTEYGIGNIFGFIGICSAIVQGGLIGMFQKRN